MRLQTRLLILMILTLLGAGACKEAPEETASMPAADTPMVQVGPVKYRVELTPLWTKDNFPF